MGVVSARPTPSEQGDRRVYSVADFNRGVAGWIGRLPPVWVEGELAELRRSGNWATVFLVLKDTSTGAVLPACMPRHAFDRLATKPARGEQVQAHGSPELFAARGEFRLRVTAIEPVGIGALLRRVEEVRRRLAADGLFAAERKRPLPFLPRTIGLVCGSDAAAKQDVIETASGRYPPARFVVLEVPVQGPSAAPGILHALRRLDANPAVDVIVLARGGGSVEDLLPFSDERVCRAVAACATPVVSAIGHEGDTPLVDLAADVRAGTPSLAAKLVVPDHAAVVHGLDLLLERAARALENGAGRARRELDALAARPAFASPRSWFDVRRAQLRALRGELDRLPRLRLERERTRLDGACDRLRLLGPAATLERGYAIVQDAGGTVVREGGDVAPGDPLRVTLARGRLAARVEAVEP
jgi:exodeoxyribonuclease VII large subunit